MLMNNKRLGTQFERQMCEILKRQGWWVHFLSPNEKGQQPFDIVAVKDDVPIAIDCKTSSKRIIRISRLEEDQKTAFNLWLSRGNSKAYIAVKYKSKVYMIPFTYLEHEEAVDLDQWGAYYEIKVSM